MRGLHGSYRGTANIMDIYRLQLQELTGARLSNERFVLQNMILCADYTVVIAEPLILWLYIDCNSRKNYIEIIFKILTRSCFRIRSYFRENTLFCFVISDRRMKSVVLEWFVKS